MIWRTSKRELKIDRPLVMAIMNLTPDSFSDGGGIVGIDGALRRAEEFIEDGADILDVGGESTRPGSVQVAADEEIRRVVPAIEAIAKRFDVAISVDTSKSEVARAAIGAGAEIINDISALRFDENVGVIAAESRAGLILMHSRGEFGSMHAQPPVNDILDEVHAELHDAIAKAEALGVASDRIALDAGIGFGKTPEQNLELIAKLDRLVADFPQYPMMIGTSRKSFIAKFLGDVPVDRRLAGSLATVAIAVWNGASIVRVHDVRETVETIRMVSAVRNQV